MIKLYSDQEKPDVIPSANNVITTETDWWMIYNASTSEVIVPPQQCVGFTSSPFTMAVSDNKEELYQHIQENSLILPPDSNDFLTDNIE